MFRIVAAAALALGVTAGAARAYDCSADTHRRASTRIQLLLGAGVLQNADGPSVFVADSFWNGMSYPDKQRFAEQFACAVAGVGNGLAAWRFRSLRSGNTIGDWNGSRLTVR